MVNREYHHNQGLLFIISILSHKPLSSVSRNALWNNGQSREISICIVSLVSGLSLYRFALRSYVETQ